MDNVDFLAELDKLESDPAQPKADVISACQDHASRFDGADEGRFSAVIPEPPAPAPAASVPPTRSAKPGRPVKLEKPLRLETPGRIEMPFRPEVPSRPERPVNPKKPVRPVHVDEIGESGQTRATVVSAVSAPQPRHVPAAIAALMVVLCFGAGAGSAAMVFHDRVAQIVETWKN